MADPPLAVVAALGADDEADRVDLVTAPWRRGTGTLEALLAAGADPDADCSAGGALLHVCACGGVADHVAVLLAAGASVDPVDGNGRTPSVLGHL